MKVDEYKNEINEIHADEDLINKTINKVKLNEKKSKKGKFIKAIAGTAAVLVVSFGSVGAYTAISGDNSILEKFGVKISQNYEKNRALVESSEDTKYMNDDFKIDLISTSMDNTNMILEFEVKFKDEVNFESVDLVFNDLSIKRKDANYFDSDVCTYSDNSVVDRKDDGSYVIYKYISVQNNAIAGAAALSTLFEDSSSVDCKVYFNELFDAKTGKTIYKFEDKLCEFDFTLKKPEAEIENTQGEVDVEGYMQGNVRIKFIRVSTSSFGNTISFVAEQKGIDVNNISDVQKADFKIIDESGNEHKIVSKTSNITMGDYDEGKLNCIGIEYQITVDDSNSNPQYKIEVVLSDEVIVSKEEIMAVNDTLLESCKNKDYIITSDGASSPVEFALEGDYYMDNYGVNRSKYTARELSQRFYGHE